MVPNISEMWMTVRHAGMLSTSLKRSSSPCYSKVLQDEELAVPYKKLHRRNRRRSTDNMRG